MTDIHKRTVTVNANGNTVISNLRVPFQRGETVWVQTSADTVVVTVEKPEEEPCAHAHISRMTEQSPWICVDCGTKDVVLP